MQQINLYLTEFRPSTAPLRAIHMAWGLVVLSVFLCLTTAYTYYQYSRLSKEYAGVDQIQKNMQTQMQTLATTKPVTSVADLEVKIQRLQEELQHRQELISVISSQNLGNELGFSAQLLALAEESLDTISIEGFSLQQSGNYAEFVGKTKSADQIPLYVQRLRATDSFANVGFGVLNIQRDETTGVLQFSLARAVEEQAEKKKMTAKDIHNALIH